ncbi:MAG TPA: hypothetical protein PK830_03130 [Candidatus Atribacteria bacterium]|nr:hypothetical protein [Candidatus Atribacteria bacterium]
MAQVTCSVCGRNCDEAITRSCPECGDCVCDDCGTLFEGYCQGCYNYVTQHYE